MKNFFDQKKKDQKQNTTEDHKQYKPLHKAIDANKYLVTGKYCKETNGDTWHLLKYHDLKGIHTRCGLNFAHGFMDCYGKEEDIKCPICCNTKPKRRRRE